MARRTLQASKTGIERAKRALKRLGLTQKDLTIAPLIASWSTISGFFNGRAIDHTIFKDICFNLALDWQEIYEPPDESEFADAEVEPAEVKPAASESAAGNLGSDAIADALWGAVQQQAIAAREALGVCKK